MPSPHRLSDGPLLPVPSSPSWRRLRFRGLVATLLIGLVAVAVVYHRPLLTAYARLFRVDDPAPCDAIVMLLGGPDARPRKVAELYRAGLAKRVVFCSGGLPPPGLMNEAIASAGMLVADGVPLSAITIVGAGVTSTKEEAEALLPYLRGQGMKRITVVTTAYHTARSRWIFGKVFRGSGIEVRTAAATDLFFNESNWFERDESVIAYFIETIKLLLYRLRY